MKKIFTLFISLIIFGSSYAQTYYFNSDADGLNPEWRDAPGVGQGNLKPGVPNSTTDGISFIVESGIYTSLGGEIVDDFTVYTGVIFKVNGLFIIEGKFKTNSGLPSNTHVEILASSILDLTSGKTPIFGSQIWYTENSSALYLGKSPTVLDFARADPAITASSASRNDGLTLPKICQAIKPSLKFGFSNLFI